MECNIQQKKKKEQKRNVNIQQRIGGAGGRHYLKFLECELNNLSKWQFDTIALKIWNSAYILLCIPTILLLDSMLRTKFGVYGQGYKNRDAECLLFLTHA